LVDAEQHVRRDDPSPRRSPDDEQRNRDTDQPASDEDRLASVAVAERSCKEVGASLDESEGDDEGERDGETREAEVFLGKERQDRALLADHSADESVDGDEQAKLCGVLAKAESGFSGS